MELDSESFSTEFGLPFLIVVDSKQQSIGVTDFRMNSENAINMRLKTLTFAYERIRTREWLRWSRIDVFGKKNI